MYTYLTQTYNQESCHSNKSQHRDGQRKDSKVGWSGGTRTRARARRGIEIHTQVLWGPWHADWVHPSEGMVFWMLGSGPGVIFRGTRIFLVTWFISLVLLVLHYSNPQTLRTEDDPKEVDGKQQGVKTSWYSNDGMFRATMIYVGLCWSWCY